MLSTLMESIANHIYEIIVLIVLIVIVAIITRTFTRWTEARNSVQLSELAIKRDKLAMIKQQELLKDLAEASVVLKDTEKERLNAIQEDIAILSRKNIALMNEVEAKTTRLERGASLATMQNQVQRIYEQEKKLFGIKEEK